MAGIRVLLHLVPFMCAVYGKGGGGDKKEKVVIPDVIVTQKPPTVQLDGNVVLTCSFPTLAAPKSLFWFKADDILFAYTGTQKSD